MLNELINRYPVLEGCKDSMAAAVEMIKECYNSKGKLLLCGNGGSCADCEHIMGELMKGFLKKRPITVMQREEMKRNYNGIDESALDKLQQGLPAIALTAFCGLNSAFCNDVDPALIYAQAFMGLRAENDILIAISTSGNSANVVEAAKIAKAMGNRVIALTGIEGGRLKAIADITITAPEKETFKVQELHLPIYHYICAAIEEYYFSE